MLILKSISVLISILQLGTAIPLTVTVTDVSTCIEDITLTTSLEYSSTSTSTPIDTKINETVAPISISRESTEAGSDRASTTLSTEMAKVAAAVSTSVASSSISIAASSASSINGSTMAPTSGTLQAPQPDIPVPTDAAIYSTTGPDFDMTSFYTWRQNIRNDQLHNGKYASKFMKVQPGNYNLIFTDKNHNNIDVTFWAGGWTLDLRGCTFTNKFDGSVPDSPNPLIYVNQAGPTLTILGGTFWQDVGEIWSQGKVRSVVADPSAGFDMSLVTVEIDAGYDTKVWSDNGARAASSKTPPAIECVDVSNPDHYTRPDCNFWYMKMDSLSVSNRTVTLAATSRTGVKEGYYLAIPLGKSMGTTLVNEDMAGLTVNGLTTNGAFTYIGHITSGPPVFKNTYIVNQPLHSPDQAPRVNGPTFSNGHIGLFDLCEFPPCETYPGSMWQYTGNSRDLMAMNVSPALPGAGL